jgi:hypothetical protein
MLLMTAVILLASPLEPSPLVDDPSGVFVPTPRTKDQMPSVEDREWARWPAIVATVVSIPTALAGMVALFGAGNGTSIQGDTYRTAAILDFGLAGSLLLAGIIYGVIATMHNNALLSDPEQ